MFQRLIAAISRRTNRFVKSCRQRLLLNIKGPTKFALVVGCQRSGTTMLSNILGRSSYILTYGETTPPFMRRDFRISDDKTILKALQKSTAQLVVAKPICDAQNTDRLLEKIEHSKAIWIYRHYHDVVNSSLKKFQGQYDRMGWFANEEWEKLDWRVERVNKSHQLILLMQSLYGQGATRADAAALMWALRTGLYLDLNLDQNDSVMLVKYESLVTQTTEQIREICEFLGIVHEDKLVSTVHSRSIAKNSAPELHPSVEKVCERLQSQLDRFWQSRQNDKVQT